MATQDKTTPAETKTKDTSKTSLVQVNFGLDAPDNADREFRAAVLKAAADAQLSLAGWAKLMLAKVVNVTLAEPPEKTAKTPAEKAAKTADSRLTLLVLMRNHAIKVGGADSAAAKREQAKLDAAVKKLAATEGIGPDKANSLLAATEKAVAAAG